MTNNPWCDIPLDVYESHMSMESVSQMQALSAVMAKQFHAYAVCSVAVLGVAGGNGLEHIGENIKSIYGIDVNARYLQTCSERYQSVLGDRLKLLELDLCGPEAALPQVDLLVANLVIEYLGLEIFCRKASAANVRYVSCVIQRQDEAESFVSKSPYDKTMKKIDGLHRNIDPARLSEEMERRGYRFRLDETIELPCGKQFLRMDYEKNG